MSSDTVDRILKSAESQARTGGYNAFSFREIAKDIGIKSSSIHYHFPTKADLATELTKRYTEKFTQHLEMIDVGGKDLISKLSDYADLFYEALRTDQKMCLCGLFAAEADALPDEVKAQTQKFFKTNISWLEDLLTKHDVPSPESEAMKLLANMEGAMLLAKAFESEKHFKGAIDLSKFE